MKIYFNQVLDQDVEDFGSDAIFGPNDTDNFFYNYLEFGSNPGGLEEVVVGDSCDRIVPVSVEAIPDLIQALTHCYNLHSKIVTAQAIADVVQDEEVEMYVENNAIRVNVESVQDALIDLEY